jgi:tripartite-type tricarboxylate transporter receptor subunit TctC
MTRHTTMMTPFRTLTSLAAVAAMTIFLPGSATAANYYSGKNIKLTVGSNPGGGYDAYTRLLGRHMSRIIPSKPKITVLNMPGGGGLKSVRYTYLVAKKDGTEFANIRASNALDSILGIRGKEFDFLKFVWVGSMASDTDVCSFWHTTGITSFNDILTKPTSVAATGKGAQAFTFPNAINNVLGTKMKIILGYKGTGARVLAIEQGEVMGSCGINGSTLMSRLTHLIKDKKLIPVVQSGLKPHPALKHVPLTQSFAKTPEQREILTAIFSQMAIARPYAAPPGTPAKAAKILRTAFDKAMKDAKLLKEAKRLRMEISPTDSAGTQAIIVKLSAMPGGLKKKVRKAVGR